MASLIHSETLRCKDDYKEWERVFPLVYSPGTIIDLIILTDRCCLYWVDHLQSIAKWEIECKKERGRYTDRKNRFKYYWWKSNKGTSTLSNEHPEETETTPSLVLLRWELQSWRQGVAKSYVNVQNKQQIPIASISHTWKMDEEALG